MPATKIATCCYCGTRAALVLRGKDRHELSCTNCGAPLHMMKMLPKAPGRATAPTATPARPDPADRAQPARPGKRRKRKSLGRKIFSEIWDVLEDVVDEVFD